MTPSLKETNLALQTKVAELEAEVERLRKELAEVTTKSAKAPRVSKARTMAEALLAKFRQKGELSKEDLAEINPKYPSDVVYCGKTVLGLQIATVKEKGKPTIYRLVAEPAPAPNGNGNGNGEVNNGTPSQSH